MQIQVYTGHTLYIKHVQRSAVPLACVAADQFTKHWVVHNFDEAGLVFFYVARGHINAPRQYVVWYPNGKMWSSYGKTVHEAIEGAMRNGWKYAT